jgi:hypothetical protein
MRLILKWATVLACAELLGTFTVAAQYPVQSSKSNQNTPEVRAVGVLEWTGDQAHPKGSRLVPVSVYDGQELQDGGIYLARPAPLALSSEVEYELKDNGKTVGFFDIDNAGQVQGSWVGFGVWKPLPKPKPLAHSTAAAQKEVWADDAQSDRPVLHRKAHSGDSSGADSDKGGSSGSAPDPDRPTLHKKDSGDGGSDSSAASGGSSPASDPDRPTLHKKASSDDSSEPSAGSGSAPDPDRPTLHKKASDDDSSSSSAPSDPDRPILKKKGKSPEDVAYVDSVKTPSDPDRPMLHRGKSSEDGLGVAPTLVGLPPDMRQVVAVSDAKSRPEHLWTYSWANPDDEAKMKATLEDLARAALGLTPPAPPPAPARKTAASLKKKASPPPPPAPAPLLDEQFRVFELAYGSGATMVLSAHTDGAGAKEKFVTLVAQPDLYGNVLVLVKNVTDAAHLDDKPRMRLVDAVDAMADNRGELLFELRGETQRQFALYRVLRGQADRLFATGPGEIATAPTTRE